MTGTQVGPTTPRLLCGRKLAEFSRSGALKRLDIDGLSMLLYPGTELEPGLGGLWLRLLNGDDATPHPLTGPGSRARLAADRDSVVLTGHWHDLAWRARFRFADHERAWFWHVDVTNHGDAEMLIDLVWSVDAALTPYQRVRTNEYYVSQYLDLTPISARERGTALAVRQNMPGRRNPWVLLGSLRAGAQWATDALQLTGLHDGRPALVGLRRTALPATRLQHEHTLATLSEVPFSLSPGQSHHGGFYGLLLPDHPEATSDADAGWVTLAVNLPEASLGFEPVAPTEPCPDTSTLFSAAPDVAVRDLSLAELADLIGASLHRVRPTEGPWWECASDSGETFTSAAKERAVLRPHGHILRTGHSLTPDTGVLTSTIWMSGVFASQVTQGHVGRTKLISGRRTYLGLQGGHGLRIFVDQGDGWRLLGTPSAWGLTPGGARWLYAAGDSVWEVTAAAPTDGHAIAIGFRVLRGDAPSILAAAHLATEGDDGQVEGRPAISVDSDRVTGSCADGSFSFTCRGGATVGDDAPLFTDGLSRGLPWLTWRGHGDLDLVLTTQLVSPAEALAATVAGPPDLWQDVRSRLRLTLAAGELAGEVADLDAVLPWFTHNAFVHYLSPRGLEQHTGGAWGTRDVCQGPVGLLLALGRADAIRDLLLSVLAGQNERGDWAQAFDFLPPRRFFDKQFDAHGDVIFWPLLAIGEYLQASADSIFVEAEVEFVGPVGGTQPAPVLEHLERALRLVELRTVPGSPLPAYGHGDWNDSLQPADASLAARMASTWTAVLQVQALRTLASGLRRSQAEGRARTLAERAESMADATEKAIREHLFCDGLLVGYGVFDEAGSLTEQLVRPGDNRTGLSYGVLPWIHAISADLLDREQARVHLDALAHHLLGPDGARLFDRPTGYRGGPMQVFQRAEAATFWGREIGLMYTHAHLRYAEALARFGDAAGLFAALNLAHPVGLTERVRTARPRQSTCYFSSSDAAFADREDAAEHYRRIFTGEVGLEGGWRVYSSGPGLFLRLVVECLLGIRRRGDRLEIDPVLDPRLDGLVAQVPLGTGSLRVRYRILGNGCGVRALSVGQAGIATTPLANPYRSPGVSVAIADLGGGPVTVEVC